MRFLILGHRSQSDQYLPEMLTALLVLGVVACVMFFWNCHLMSRVEDLGNRVNDLEREKAKHV